MSDHPFDELRAEYRGRGFAGELPPDPAALFDRWYAEACAEQIPLANAMTLATASPGGAPSARVVLLKEIDEAGQLWFFTSYESRKAAELEANPRAALLFFWEPLHRQIRIEGTVSRLGAADSDRYFAKRPRASNLSAMVSRQSAPLAGGRPQLELERAELEAAWKDRELERPRSWGGYALAPGRFEFWQGREDRLHERLCYVREADSWRREWLYP